MVIAVVLLLFTAWSAVPAVGALVARDLAATRTRTVRRRAARPDALIAERRRAAAAVQAGRSTLLAGSSTPVTWIDRSPVPIPVDFQRHEVALVGDPEIDRGAGRDARRSHRPPWSNRSGSDGSTRRSSPRSPCRASSAAHSGPENMPTISVGSKAANIAVASWAGTALSGSLALADPRLVADDDDPRAAADRDVARQHGLGHDGALVLLDAVDRDRDPVGVDVLEALGDRADVERRDRERREGSVDWRAGVSTAPVDGAGAAVAALVPPVAVGAPDAVPPPQAARSSAIGMRRTPARPAVRTCVMKVRPPRCRSGRRHAR